MSLREELVMLAQGQQPMRSLCRRFEISPTTAYKWRQRYRELGRAGLADRSRRPGSSPTCTAAAMQTQLLQLRQEHPAWGGRKLRAYLLNHGQTQVPAASTISDILRRHGLIDPAEASKHRPWQRFEYAQPNDLWQMDFLGHFPLGQGRCHTLTVLDDHSRFCIGARACLDETGTTVQKHLSDMFRCCGLPQRILSDNGTPWGCREGHRYTWLSAWLIRLGIGISHGRACHPQTQGKDERFHRTLRAEALAGRQFDDCPAVQRRLDEVRQVYNQQRPHEALNLQPPASRYRPSPRLFPQTLPPIQYHLSDVVRKVNKHGYIGYRNIDYHISEAFTGYPVALRATDQDGQINVFFCQQQVATIDLRTHNA